MIRGETHTRAHFKQPTTDALTDNEQIFNTSPVSPHGAGAPARDAGTTKGELRLQPASCRAHGRASAEHRAPLTRKNAARRSTLAFPSSLVRSSGDEQERGIEEKHVGVGRGRRPLDLQILPSWWRPRGGERAAPAPRADVVERARVRNRPKRRAAAHQWGIGWNGTAAIVAIEWSGRQVQLRLDCVGRSFYGVLLR